MYLKIFGITFIILGLLSGINFTLFHFGIIDKMKPMKASDYIAFVSGTLLLYVINALVLILLLNGINKLYVLLFASVPFVIGKLTEYKTLGKFAVIQIVIIFCSIIYMAGLLY